MVLGKKWEAVESVPARFGFGLSALRSSRLCGFTLPFPFSCLQLSCFSIFLPPNFPASLFFGRGFAPLRFSASTKPSSRSMSRSVNPSELHLFYEDLVQKLRDRGVVCAITSGLACVHYGIAETAKDCELDV